MGIGNPAARRQESGERSHRRKVFGKGAARADRESGAQTAVWDGAGRAWRVACRCLPGHDRCGCREWRVSCATRRGRRLSLHLLVEDVLGLRLRQGVPVRYSLDGRVVPGGRPIGGADPRRLGRFTDVVENPLRRGGLGDEGDDSHVGAAVLADQLAKDSNRRASSKHGPQVACWGGGALRRAGRRLLPAATAAGAAANVRCPLDCCR